MIVTEKKHLEIIQAILAKYPYTFYVFGSRAPHGKPKRLSDLDLCFIEPIPGNVQSHIDEDFEESDLPYTVDLVDWNLCSKDFQESIRNDLVRIQGDKELPK